MSLWHVIWQLEDLHGRLDQSMAACGVVIVGFFLGSWGEVNFSLAGLIFGLISSVFVALYGIYVKKVMHLLNDDHWYVCCCCCCWLLLLGWLLLFGLLLLLSCTYYFMVCVTDACTLVVTGNC
jgi:drug/metabolite transporter (DMT)-like permease